MSLLTATFCPAQAVPTASASPQPTPLILEKNEGERRVLRGWPGHPDPTEALTLKLDPKNGGSQHLVVMAADFSPGGQIDPHRHPGADEVLYLLNGTARVRVGKSEKIVHAGAMVFIPAGTVISAINIGKTPISVVAVFSAPGFEEYMREVSVPEGQKAVPLTAAEDDAIAKKHAHDVVYEQP
jgi:quercetin dioxygenase-like cupin family protein